MYWTLDNDTEHIIPQSYWCVKFVMSMNGYPDSGLEQTASNLYQQLLIVYQLRSELSLPEMFYLLRP